MRIVKISFYIRLKSGTGNYFSAVFFFYCLLVFFPYIGDDFYFFGTKGCIKKKLISPQWLRNIKGKKLKECTKLKSGAKVFHYQRYL